MHLQPLWEPQGRPPKRSSIDIHTPDWWKSALPSSRRIVWRVGGLQPWADFRRVQNLSSPAACFSFEKDSFSYECRGTSLQTQRSSSRWKAAGGGKGGLQRGADFHHVGVSLSPRANFTAFAVVSSGGDRERRALSRFGGMRLHDRGGDAYHGRSAGQPLSAEKRR